MCLDELKKKEFFIPKQRKFNKNVCPIKSGFEFNLKITLKINTSTMYI